MYRSKVLLLALATSAAIGSASCVATGSSECFVGANTAFEADAAGKRCCEAPDGTWGVCPEQMTGSTTSGIGTSTSPTTTTDWTSTSTTTWTTSTSSTDPLSTSTTTSSSTTASDPICGDGKVEGEGDDAEECDDGNTVPGDGCGPKCKLECGDGNLVPEFGEECDDGDRDNGDGCSEKCLKEWVMFVTRKTYQGNFGSIEKANEHCAKAVDGKEGRPKFEGEYVAWLSDSKQLAMALLPPGKTFVDTKGDTIIDEAEHLVDTGGDGPQKNINLDENGLEILDWVWTGTLPNGTTSMGGHCQGWTNSEALGYAGYTGEKDLWTDWTIEGTYACKEDYHLYCFRADI